METIKVIEQKIKICDECKKELDDVEDFNHDTKKFFSCQICKKDLCQTHTIKVNSEANRHLEVYDLPTVCKNCYDIHIKSINDKLKVLMDEVDKLDDELTEKFPNNRIIIAR